MSWNDSMILCEEEAGYLAIDDNKVTHDYMAQIHGLVSMWIGATYNEGMDQWTWHNGETINKIYWNGIQPGGGNVQWCLITNYLAVGVWNYSSCENLFPFLCQKQSMLHQVVNITFNNSNINNSNSNSNDNENSNGSDSSSNSSSSNSNSSSRSKSSSIATSTTTPTTMATQQRHHRQQWHQ